MKNITFNLNVEFASQAEELNNRIPYGYINKTVCGCGLTTLAIENNRNTIIAVPNLDLITNKVEQYPNERKNYKLLGVYGGVFEKEVYEYLNEIANKQPAKIFVTYDSLYKVDFLMAQDYDIVIDESQELLQSIGLKLKDKDLEKEDVLSYLYRKTEQYKERVSFISATPIPVKYLADFISELPQVTINWANTIDVKPYLMKRAQPISALKKELITPILENGYTTVEDLTVTKLIVFVNSITAIKKIIKDSDLQASDIGYIVGKNLKNDVDFKKYKRVGATDVLPKFTFITSTGFKGIDLSDKEALSVVISITSKEHTMVNMKTDLKQAISRQRNKQNRNYGKYIFIYNQTVFEEDDETIINKINEVRNGIDEGIKVYNIVKENNLKKGLSTMIGEGSDFSHYTIYNAELDSYTVNEPAFRADEYFILELRNQYKKGFKMQKAFGEEAVKVSKIEIQGNFKFEELVDKFKEQESIHNNIDDSRLDIIKKIEWGVMSKHKNWIKIIEKSYELYGKVWKNQVYSEEMINNFYNPDNHFRIKFCTLFNVGGRYTRADVKVKLAKLYEKEKLKRAAKHTDLNEYFEVKDVKVNGERMVEIIRRK